MPMKRINLLYDLEYDDVDILLVPDYIADNIESIVRHFNIWLQDSKNAQPFLKTDNKGMRYLNIETEDFLWWINNVIITDGCKAEIEKQHVPYSNEYPVAEF